MSIENLRRVLQPPRSAIETGSSDAWSQVEEQLELRLPDDYKSYIRTYGTGCIGEFVWPLNPFSRNPNLNFLRAADEILSAMRSLRDGGYEDIPFPLYPERGGLLPWGFTDNGDNLYWVTRGDSNEWPVVLNASRQPAYEYYDCSMTEFLAKVLQGELESHIMPSDLAESEPLFRSGWEAAPEAPNDM